MFNFLLRQNLAMSLVFLRMKDVQERSEQIQSLFVEKHVEVLLCAVGGAVIASDDRLHVDRKSVV